MARAINTKIRMITPHYIADSISSARGQLSERTIERHGQMVGISQELSGIYDKVSDGVENIYSVMN